jgi:signal transduction histidine kinase
MMGFPMRRACVFGGFVIWLIVLAVTADASAVKPPPRSALIVKQSDTHRPWPRAIVAVDHLQSVSREGYSGKSIDQQIPAVSGGRVQLQQVVLNLPLNAIESMQSIDTTSRVPRVKSDMGNPGEAVVSVADTGIGINPVDLPRVFEWMFTTTPQGMEMGLSICRSIIEAYGGRLRASVNASGGCLFLFTLPIGGEC